MPRKPIDYSNTYFYKIVCNDPEIKSIYVGHTTDFKRRKYEHKSCSENVNGKMYNKYVYKAIRENGGFENWSMILIDTLHCENSLDAKMKERQFMEELQASLNKAYPTRSRQEYYQTNKEEFKQRNKENYEKNKEAYNKRKKEYLEENKKYFKENKRQYYIENKDIISEKAKIYRQKSQAKLKENKRIYYDNNRETIIQKGQEYYQNNIEKKKEYDRIYREQNKEKKRKERMTDYTEKEIEKRFYRKKRNTGKGRNKRNF